MLNKLIRVTLSACIISFFFSCAANSSYIPERKPIVVANRPPFELAKVDIGVNTALFGVKVTKQESTVMYHPKTNDVSLDFVFYMNKVTLLFDHVARQYFQDSLEQYISEFNEKKLTKKGNTKARYYKATGLLKWGTITQNGESLPEIRYGYIISGNGAYFTITVYEGKNYSELSRDYMKTNPAMTLCLSIAQAQKIVELMGEDNIKEALANDTIQAPNIKDSEADAYSEE